MSEQYIVSARKYRPDSFSELIGQDNIARTLKNSIIRGQLAHAYLFCGPRGVGKTSTARIFAKAINCSNPSKDMEPCGKCESCLSFQEGRSYCIHELDAASNNGVEDIKALMDQVQIPPQVGKYSVYIIDEVHMLSTAAFNAFLKTLEEPPAYAIFILATTEKHKVLPTILSRCQTYDFNRISVTDMVNNMRSIAVKEKVKIDDESLHVIAMKADGAMRDALTIFDQTVAFCGQDVKYADVIRNLNVLDYEYSFSLVEDFLSGDYPKALLSFDEILSKGFNALHFMGALSSHFRDLIVSKSGGLDALLELPESLKKRYKEQADKCSLQFLYDALNVTTQCEAAYKTSLNPRLHIEFALMKLSFLNGGEVSVKAATSAAAAPKQEVSAAPKPKEETKPVAVKVVEPAPAPSPKPHRKQARSGASLSLSAMIEEVSDTAGTSSLDGEDDKLPSDEDVIGKWKALPEKYKDRPRLATALSNAEFEITEENGQKILTFQVMNVAQQKWIQEKLLHDIEDTLRKSLGTSKLALIVSVIPEQEVKKTNYMPEEQAKELMTNNDQVRKLVSELGLDIK